MYRVKQEEKLADVIRTRYYCRVCNWYGPPRVSSQSKTPSRTCWNYFESAIWKKIPQERVIKNWATQFITKHHEKLGTYWSSSLDSSRAHAVNPHTKEEYYAMLKKVQEDFDICDELIYGADETGIQTGIGVTERVIGPAGAKIQHQQRSGNRENITVLPTICGWNINPSNCNLQRRILSSEVVTRKSTQRQVCHESVFVNLFSNL